MGQTDLALVTIGVTVMSLASEDRWAVTTLLVCASVVVHGMTATPLSRLYGRRAGGRAQAEEEQKGQ